MNKLILTPIVLLLASACETVGEPDFFSEQSQYVFGDAVAKNIAAQTVNPDAGEGQVETSAARSARAQQRYAEDQVEEPTGADTLSGTSGNGGGGSGGGGGN